MRVCPTCAPTFAHVSAPKRASPFRRCGLRAARLAGVRLGVGVQRKHRRVEHRVGHLFVLGMRRFSAGGAPPRRTRSAGLRCGAAVVRGGTADARAHTYRHSLGRVSTCVCIAAFRRRWNICIRIYLYISNIIGRVYMEHTHIWYL